MISAELSAEILRLYAQEKWPIGTIARHKEVHHGVVRRVIAQAAGSPPRPARRGKLDDFLPFIQEILQRYPTLCASRIHGMARERGLRCCSSHFRAAVAKLRPPRVREAFLRLRTLPGEQGQVDWAHFGVLTVGQAERKLYAFVFTLSYSRKLFVQFGFDIGMAGFLAGHAAAFEAFGGVPRVLLYDNLKSAVLDRVGDAIRFHPTILSFSKHYGYEPRPVAVARGNEKGRVERSIRYLRTSFMAARTFKDLADLNCQVALWCVTQAEERRWPQDARKTVSEAFAAEQPALMPLPLDRFDTASRREVRVAKTPYVRFDANDYSVPHSLVGRSLAVLADAERVRVLDGDREVASHLRSWDRAQLIEDPQHIADLVVAKRDAHQHRGQHRVLHAVPSAEALMMLLAQRGEPLGSSVAYLGKLLDEYGPSDMEVAVGQAVQAHTPHPHSVRLLLQKLRFARGLPPAAVRPLVANPKLRDIEVQPHDLATYDSLSERLIQPTPAAESSPATSTATHPSKETRHV